MDCLICGGPVVITPRLFAEADDRWDCLRCSACGTVSERKDAPKPEESHDEPKES